MNARVIRAAIRPYTLSLAGGACAWGKAARTVTVLELAYLMRLN